MKGIFHPALHKAVVRCSSWEDFVGRLSRLSEKKKGDVFEHLVRAYLLLDPEYATKLRSVWLLKDVPSALRKKLRLPADDHADWDLHELYAWSLAIDVKRELGDDYYVEFGGREIHDDFKFLKQITGRC